MQDPGGTTADCGQSTNAACATCVLCGGASTRWNEIDGYWIRQCRSCGHQFAELSQPQGHIERIYGDTYFQGGAAGYTDYFAEEELLINRGAWYARRLSAFCETGTVLDVGAAAGFTLAGFADAGWQCFGLEPNATMARYATERFGFPVEPVSFESWTANRSFDLVNMLQVFPHFLDPNKMLAKAADLLNPGGHLLIESWNRASWTARLFGRHWHEYSPPSVMHWFSKAAMIRLAESRGLQVVASGRPSKWIGAGHAKSLLRSKADASVVSRMMLGVANLIPNRAALPYPLGDLVWILFRRG
jgi:SAM-dependent methyltransferase